MIKKCNFCNRPVYAKKGNMIFESADISRLKKPKPIVIKEKTQFCCKKCQEEFEELYPEV